MYVVWACNYLSLTSYFYKFVNSDFIFQGKTALNAVLNASYAQIIKSQGLTVALGVQEDLLLQLFI